MNGNEKRVQEEETRPLFAGQETDVIIVRAIFMNLGSISDARSDRKGGTTSISRLILDRNAARDCVDGLVGACQSWPIMIVNGVPRKCIFVTQKNVQAVFRGDCFVLMDKNEVEERVEIVPASRVIPEEVCRLHTALLKCFGIQMVFTSLVDAENMIREESDTDVGCCWCNNWRRFFLLS